MILEEYTKKALSFHYPSIYERAVEYKMVSGFEWAIKLSDGSVVIFDRSEERIRNMTANADEMTEDEYRTELGHRIRSRMMMKGISQLELSELTGIKQPQLSRYINGNTLPSMYAIARIAKGLGCTVNELNCTY